MLQGLAHTICVYAKKASGGGGGENTPNAVNWVDMIQVSSKTGNQNKYSAQQITGISTSITLQTVFSNTALTTLWYKVQSTSTVPANTSMPTSNGYTNISHNGTVSVSNNEYLVFAVTYGYNGTSTITVKNNSDGDATLDTFTASSRFS